MTKALQELREELIDEGWLPKGHGDKPWSYRYYRPCIDLPPVPLREVAPRRVQINPG